MKRGAPAETNEPETPVTPGAKKIKFDENDIDYLIGDLRKEESMLVFTRLLKKNLPNFEDLLREEIDRVRLARASLTPDQVKDQIQQLQQLNALQQIQARMSFSPQPVPQFNFSGFSPAAFGGFPMTPGGGGSGGGGGMAPTFDQGQLRGIRSQIKDAIKKSKNFGMGSNFQWKVQIESVMEQAAKARDFVLSGSADSLRIGFDILEAITEEFTERGAEIGLSSIEGYDECMNKLAQEWLDAFLTRPCDLDEDERKGWSLKLKTWDKSADKESALVAASIAALNGWENEQLKALLAEDGVDGSSYVEPKTLVLARMSVLEREKKSKEALRLARAANHRCGLGQQLGKLLLRTGNTEEALKAAKSITEPSQLFSLAQIAKPIDPLTAFKLAILAVSVEAERWNDSSKDRSLWLIDLASTENILDKLITESVEVVWHKPTLWELSKLLVGRMKVKYALQLAQHIIIPHSLERLQSLWKQTDERLVLSGARKVATVDALIPTTRLQLLRELRGTDVPLGLLNWMFDLAYEHSERNSKSELMVSFINSAITSVDNVQELISLLQKMNSRAEYDLVDQVGARCLDLIIEQEKKDLEYQERDTRERHELSLVVVAPDKPAPTYVPHPIDHARYNFSESKMTVCKMMIDAAIAHKALYVEKNIKNAAVSNKMDIDSDKEKEEKEKAEKLRVESLENCTVKLNRVVELSLVKLSNPQHLSSLASSCSAVEEYRLSLKILEEATRQVIELEKKYEEREVWMTQKEVLSRERDVLLQQRIQMDQQKSEELAKLVLKSLLFQTLAPQVEKSSNPRYLGDLMSGICKQMIDDTIYSANAYLPSERLGESGSTAVVDLILKSLKSPISLQNQVLPSCRENYKLKLKIAERCLQVWKDLRELVLQRVELTQEIAFIDQEKLAAGTTPLPSEIEGRYNELKEKLQQLPKAVYFEPGQPSQVTSYITTLISEMMRAAILNRSEIERQLKTPSADLAQKEQQLLAQLADANALEKEIFERCVSELNAPEDLVGFSGVVAAKPELVRIIVQKTVPILVECEEKRQKNDVLLDELFLLNEEKKALAASKMLLPQEKLERLRELQLKNTIDSALNRKVYSASEISTHLTKLYSSLLNSLLQIQLTQNRRLHKLKYEPIQITRLIAGLDQNAATLAVEAALQSAKKESEEIENELKHLSSEIQSVVMESMSNIENPSLLINLANNFVSSRHEFQVYENPDLPKILIEHALNLIEGLEKEYIKNAPEKHELLILEQESFELEQIMQSLSQEKKERLLELQKKERLKNKMPSHLNYDSNTLHSEKVKAVRLLVKSIVDTLIEVRNVIQRTKDEMEKPKQVGAVNNNVNNNNVIDPNSTQQDSLASLTEKLASSSFNPTPLKPEVILKLMKTREESLKLMLIDTLENMVKNSIKSHDLIDIAINVSSLIRGANSFGFSKWVVEICNWSIEILEKLKKQSEERSIDFDSLEELEDEQFELKKVRKDLAQSQIEKLQKLREKDFEWSLEPEYSQQDHTVYDQYTLSAIKTTMDAVLAEKTAVLEELKSVKNYILTLESPDGMQVDSGEDLDEKKRIAVELEIQVDDVTKRLNSTVHSLYAKLTDPWQRQNLTGMLAKVGETDLVILVGKSVITSAQEAQKILDKCASLQRKIYLLKFEAAILAEKREKPSNEHVEMLAEAEKEFEKAEEPKYGLNDTGSFPPNEPEDDTYNEYHHGGRGGSRKVHNPYHNFPPSALVSDADFEDLSTHYVSDSLYQLIQSVSSDILQAVLSEENVLLAKIAEGERIGQPLENAEKKKEEMDNKKKEVTDSILDLVEDYKGVETLIRIAKNNKRHELLFQISESCLLQIKEMRKKREKIEEDERRLDELQNEKVLLENQRKSLPNEKQNEYQKLWLEKGMRAILPSFSCRTCRQLDVAAMRVFRGMMIQALEFEKSKEEEMELEKSNPRLHRSGSITEEELENQHSKIRKEIEDDIKYVIKLCTDHIDDSEHLVMLTRELNSWKHYSSLISVGTKAQEILANELDVREKYEALERKRSELQSTQISTTGIDKNLQQVLDEIRKLGNPGRHHSSILRAWVLEVANLMIDAARLENREDVVLVQSILVFKMTLTLDKFEEVHTLCPAKDWNSVKKDLLDYVVAHDSTLPGSPITLKMQIELLLSQGLWKESIQIFPDPEVNNPSSNVEGLEILELIWLEVEQKKAAQLTQLLPHIEKYARKLYQLVRYKELDRLYNLVQVHYPDFIIEIHKIGSGLIAASMQPKQYDDYCEYLKNLRARLQGLGMQKDWDDFIQATRKEHARKKKLINIFDAHEL